MATSNGIPVNFAYGGVTTVTAPLQAALLQTSDNMKQADKEDVRNYGGDHVTHSWYDYHDAASLEWVVTGTGLLNARVNTTLASLTPGSFVTIVQCDSQPDLVGSTWEVMSGAKITKSNTTSARISVQIEKRAGITGLASA